MSSDEPGRHFKLTLHYDGACFSGWQIQPGLRTVQAELEFALSRLADQPISVIGAGRTDRGVHATGQVASALMPEQWRAQSLRKSLNAILPDDIWIAEAVEAPPGFHARYGAVARSYFYRIGTAEDASSPFRRRWCWVLRDRPDLELLVASARVFIGEHSFFAFAKSGQPHRGEICTVQHAEWTAWDCGLQFDVTANRFLHHMVRYMVGTMVDVALNRRPLEDIDRLLNDRGGLETSPPAPPEGLFLSNVEYKA